MEHFDYKNHDPSDFDVVIGIRRNGSYCVLKARYERIHSGSLSFAELFPYLQGPGAVRVLWVEEEREKYGVNKHRLKDNPEEKRFADAWAKHNPLKWLLDVRPVQTGAPPPPSERDEQVAATVIQWLGSPVGQGFLNDVGWEKRAK